MLVANGHCYGGRFVCAPAADLRSPTLEVCLFEQGGPRGVIGYTLAMLAGRLPKLESCRIVSAAKVHIAGGAEEPVQGDGDVIGHLDVTIEIEPKALHLVYPPEAAQAGETEAPRFAAPAPAADTDRIAAYTPRR